jgi:hypothetical protein
MDRVHPRVPMQKALQILNLQVRSPQGRFWLVHGMWMNAPLWNLCDFPWRTGNRCAALRIHYY